MEYIRTLTREFEVGERADLHVEIRSGAVAVRGDDTQQVRVEVVARLWAESDEEADEQLDLIARGMHQDGEHVAVRAPTLLRPAGWLSIFGRGRRIDYNVAVPRATRMRVVNRSGRVEAASIAGPADIETRSGRIVVSEIGADTAIVSRSGSLQAEAIGGSLSIESRSGKVQVRGCEGSVKARTRSGAFHIEGVRGNLLVECRSGALTVSNVGGGLKARTLSGAFRYEGAVQGPFDIEVFSGAVLLAVDPDSNFFLDAETMSGSVSSDLPIRRTAADSGRQAAGPTVRIRARSGSIRIVPR